MRKVLGAGRSGLIRQFLAESVVLVVVAAVLSLLFLELLRGPFSSLTGKELDLLSWSTPQNWLILLGILGLVSLIAGSYPAFYLSSFAPLQALKGQMRGKQGNLVFRNGLVVFQFFISTSLIICTLIVIQQIHYFNEIELGFDKAQTLIIQNDKEIQEKHKRNAIQTRSA